MRVDIFDTGTVLSLAVVLLGSATALVGLLLHRRHDRYRSPISQVPPAYVPPAPASPWVPPRPQPFDRPAPAETPSGSAPTEQQGPDNDPWGTLLPGDLAPVPAAPPPPASPYAPPGPPQASNGYGQSAHAPAPRSARSAGGEDVSIRVAKIGGVFALLGVLGTGLFGLASNLASHSGTAGLSCLDERTKAAKLVRTYSGSWVPLRDDDPAQRQCGINEFVRGLN